MKKNLLKKSSKIVIKFNNITKKFGNLIANNNINIDVINGEVHALLGENGAGKSTLMSLLFGIYKPTNGFIEINGIETKIKDPKEANKFGIGMLPQHFQIVENFLAWENIILGYEKVINDGLDVKPFNGIINKKEIFNRIEFLMQKYNIKFDYKKSTSLLSISDKQKVELLKMLWRNNNILIFDEPTSILTPPEIINFLQIVKDLQKDGKTILIITHKLDEIKEISQRVSILRKGTHISTLNTNDVSKKKLAELMVGDSIDLNLSSINRNNNYKKNMVSVNDINFKTKSESTTLKNINFNIKKGEILGIAAIDGNGQSELIKILGGTKNQDSGSIIIKNINISNWTVSERYNKKRNQDEIFTEFYFDTKNLLNVPKRFWEATQIKFFYNGIISKKEVFNKNVEGLLYVDNIMENSLLNFDYKKNPKQFTNIKSNLINSKNIEVYKWNIKEGVVYLKYKNVIPGFQIIGKHLKIKLEKHFFNNNFISNYKGLE
ncbi:MAG: ATP-binding cassette domain-containing protein, partial [Mollicutes bacterium PWAP]|nr:ATP-binding cassette domain-containing protein [Mollicutes bacterium PWAP]